jgi:hypothetical protein
MRHFTAIVIGPFVLSVLVGTAASAEDKYDAMAKCYQAYGQIETVTQDGKRVTTYKDEATVAAECNAKVLERAKSEVLVNDILKWAALVGTHSNWQSAVPVFTLAVRADTTKAVCSAKDPLYALDLALAAPADHPHAIGAVGFMDACWPADKDTIAGYLTKGGYQTSNACKFLEDKHSLPDGKRWLCKSP